MMFTRRQVIQNAASAGILLKAGGSALGQPTDDAAIHVRRDISGLANDSSELKALRKGIAAMMARPSSDPASWLFQANIHGTYDSIPPQFADVWGTCQHGSFFFLSWHRMYLYFFERILRDASGDREFALPYWNYSTPAQRKLPDTFRQPPTSSNPLYVAARRPNINAGQPLSPSETSATGALKAIAFDSPTGSGSSFGGQRVAAATHFTGPHGLLESQPHDVIHVVVGGSGWMSDPNLAARDPIFWLHHCNIDRLWAHWLALGQGRSNPKAEPTWLDTKFTFYDEQRQKVTMTGAGVTDFVQQLRYRYDDLPSQIAAAPESAMPEAASAPTAPSRVIAAQPATESALSLGAKDTVVTLHPVATETAPIGRQTGPVILSFDGINYRYPIAVYYEVYLNRPADMAMDPDGPYYAGNMTFFALGHARGENREVADARTTLDVGGVLAHQLELGLWQGGEVKVELHPQGVEETTEAAPTRPLATIGQIRLLGK
jgi:hypothetical protein